MRISEPVISVTSDSYLQTSNPVVLNKTQKSSMTQLLLTLRE